MTPREVHDILNVSKTSLAMNGVFAFVTLIAVILLMQGLDVPRTDSRRMELKQASVNVFSTGFFASILAFLLFVLNMGETINVQRIFCMVMAADFAFSLSVLWVVYGAALMAQAFGYPGMAIIFDKIFQIAIGIMLLRYANTVLDVIAIMYHKTWQEIFRQVSISFPLLNAFLFCPLLAVIKRIISPDNMAEIPSRKFNGFIIANFAALIGVSLMPTAVIRFSACAFVPFGVIFFIVIIFSLLVAGMILFVPINISRQ